MKAAPFFLAFAMSLMYNLWYMETENITTDGSGNGLTVPTQPAASGDIILTPTEYKKPSPLKKILIGVGAAAIILGIGLWAFFSFLHIDYTGTASALNKVIDDYGLLRELWVTQYVQRDDYQAPKINRLTEPFVNNVDNVLGAITESLDELGGTAGLRDSRINDGYIALMTKLNPVIEEYKVKQRIISKVYIHLSSDALADYLYPRTVPDTMAYSLAKIDADFDIAIPDEYVNIREALDAVRNALKANVQLVFPLAQTGYTRTDELSYAQQQVIINVLKTMDIPEINNQWSILQDSVMAFSKEIAEIENADDVNGWLEAFRYMLSGAAG